jgi:hypothetical protein
MKYEIGNPSDKCFITADDDKVAAAVILLLGSGQYFAEPQEGDPKRNIPTFFALGGDVDATWKDAFGITFTEFMDAPENKEKMMSCFASFEYAAERSSLNNIGARAKAFAKGYHVPKTEAQP